MGKKYTPTVGVEIFIERDGKILMGKRKNTAGAGEYGLPGGHVEPNEGVLQTAIRELEEETGIHVTKEQLDLIVVADDTNPDNHYLHIAFRLTEFEGEPQLLEPEKCEGWEWVDPHNIPGAFYGHTKIIETYLKKELYLKR